jgi:hypothetical protein
MKYFLLLIICLFSICGCAANTVKVGEHLVVPSGYDSATDDSDANQILISFPENIPGAKSVTKYLSPHARFCLIHIRQSHLGPGDQPQNIVEKTFQVQKDIYEILSFFIKKYDLSSVYTEGIINEKEINDMLSHEYEMVQLKQKEIQSLKFEIEKIQCELDTVNLISFSNSPLDNIRYDKLLLNSQTYKKLKLKQLSDKRLELSALEKQMADYQTKKTEHMASGAAFILAAEGKIYICAAELAKTMLAAQQILADGSHWLYTSSDLRIVADDREDALLSIIASQIDTMTVCVLGGFHALGGRYSFGKYYSLEYRVSFVDNIYEWNQRHPDKIFSLIEIVPSHYLY